MRRYRKPQKPKQYDWPKGWDFVPPFASWLPPKVGVIQFVTPANLTPPVISGTATYGNTLTASKGTWVGPPASYAYQWYRGEVAISGETGSTYVVEAQDDGADLTVTVTATNPVGSDSATSDPVTATASIPAVRSGQTLVFRETWDASRSAASPSPWSVWTDGFDPTFTYDTPGGPTLYAADGTTRRRACLAVEQPTAAQRTAGYVLPKSNFLVPNGATANKAVLVDFWFRVSPREIYGLTSGAGRNVVTITGGTTTMLDYLKIHANPTTNNNPGQFNLAGGVVNTTFSDITTGTSDWYPVGEWVHVWFALKRTGTRTIFFEIPSLGTGVQTLVTVNSTYGYSAELRVWLGRSGNDAQPNQPWYSGQIGPISVYDCGTDYNAAAGPADYLNPSPTAGRVVAASSYADALDKIHKSVVMGGARMLRASDGTYAETDSRTSVSATARRDMLLGVADGGTVLNPRYDTVTVPSGTYRPASDGEWTLRSPALGLKIVGAGSDPAGTYTELRTTEDLADSWTDMGAAGTYPVFRYDGATRVNAHAYAPGRVELAARFAADFTAASPLLDDYPYQCWVDSTGILYVSVPVGETPSSLGTWERNRLLVSSGTFVMSDLSGAWLKDVWVSGVSSYAYQQTGSDRLGGNGSQYAAAVRVGLPHATVIQGCRAYGHSKHLYGWVGTFARGSVAVLSSVYGGQSPRQGSFPSTYSVSDGDYSALVAYTSAAGPGSGVMVVDEPRQATGYYYAVAGQAEGTGEARTAAGGRWYSHGSEATGTSWVFALIAFRWVTVPNGYFASGSPPVVPVSHAIYPATGSNYADFQVNGVSNQV